MGAVTPAASAREELGAKLPSQAALRPSPAAASVPQPPTKPQHLLHAYQQARHGGLPAADQLLRQELAHISSWQQLAAVTDALAPTGVEPLAQLTAAAVRLQHATRRAAATTQPQAAGPASSNGSGPGQLRRQAAATPPAGEATEQQHRQRCLQLLCASTQSGLGRCSNARAIAMCARNLARLGASSPQLALQVDERLGQLVCKGSSMQRDSGALSMGLWGVARMATRGPPAARRPPAAHQRVHHEQQGQPAAVQQQAAADSGDSSSTSSSRDATMTAAGSAAGADAGAAAGTAAEAAAEVAPPSAAGPSSAAAGTVGSQQAEQPLVAESERPSPGFVGTWLRASPQFLPRFKPSHLATSIYSLALLQRTPPPAWSAAFLAASQAQLPAASPHDLSSMIWALARLGLQPSAAWMAAFEAACRRQNSALPGVAVSNIVWSLAQLRRPPSAGWLTDLQFQAQRTFHEMDTRALAALAAGLADLGVSPPAPWVKRYCRAAGDALGTRTTPRAFVSVLWALARMGWRPSTPWLKAVCGAIQPHLSRFKPRDYTQALAAFGHLSHLPGEEWMFDFFLEMRLKLSWFTPGDVAAAAAALAVLAEGPLKYRPQLEWVTALMARAHACLKAANPAELSSYMASLARMGALPPQSQLAAMLQRMAGCAGHASASDLANACWALSVWWARMTDHRWLQHNVALVDELVAAAAQQLPAAGPIDLVQLASSFAAMGYHPGLEWMEAHARRCVELQRTMSGQAFGIVLQAYSELGQPPPVALQAAAAAVQQQQGTGGGRQQPSQQRPGPPPLPLVPRQRAPEAGLPMQTQPTVTERRLRRRAKWAHMQQRLACKKRTAVMRVPPMAARPGQAAALQPQQGPEQQQQPPPQHQREQHQKQRAQQVQQQQGAV